MSHAVLVYDGDCGMCEKCAGWLRSHMPHVQVVSHHAYGVKDLSAVLLVEGDIHYEGASAIARMLTTSTLRRYRFLGRVMSLVGIRSIAQVVYSMVARNRSRISRMLGLTACAVDGQRTS